MSAFADWTLIQAEKRFSLSLLPHSPLWENWYAQSKTVEIAPRVADELSRLREKLAIFATGWNEYELPSLFIGPLFSLVDFSHQRYNLFGGREMSATVDGELLFGRPDGLIASGFRTPEIPYFCLNEYKREVKSEGDPIGQCLTAMLAAQELNGNEHPVFGCYVDGRYWNFLVLKGKEYGMGPGFSASNGGILDIYRLLVALKQQIESWLPENP